MNRLNDSLVRVYFVRFPRFQRIPLLFFFFLQNVYILTVAGIMCHVSILKVFSYFIIVKTLLFDPLGGARWLSGRVSDSGARGRGLETYRRCVVSLSKTLYSPKVLVNYPGSGGSVPT